MQRINNIIKRTKAKLLKLQAKRMEYHSVEFEIKDCYKKTKENHKSMIFIFI